MTNDRHGSFLVEAMVAISLVMVGLLGIINLVAQSLRVNTDIVNRFVAANLAAEGIEVVKDIENAATMANPDGTVSKWSDIWTNVNVIPFGSYEVQYDTAVSNNLISAPSDVTQARVLCLRNSTTYHNYYLGTGGPAAQNPCDAGDKKTTFQRIVTVRPGADADHVYVTADVHWTAKDNSPSDFIVEDLFTAY